LLRYLRPGEEVVLASNPRSGSNFPPFIKLILTMFSVVAGVPYQLQVQALFLFFFRYILKCRRSTFRHYQKIR
jgi:hypothetical protein